MVPPGSISLMVPSVTHVCRGTYKEHQMEGGEEQEVTGRVWVRAATVKALFSL